MRLPRIKHDQLKLFADEPLGNHGHIRTVLGDFAEHLTAKLFRGQRYRTDSRCEYCPDVKFAKGFLEVKTVGRTRQTFIYEGRLDKDLAFSQWNTLLYVLWCHSVDSRLCSNTFELKSLFLTTLSKIIVVPFESVYEAAKLSSVTRLNSAYGHSDTSTIYGAGYRLPINRLTKFPHLALPVCRSEELF